MKKIIALVLILAMLNIFAIPSMASDTTDSSDSTHTISEQITENNITVRTIKINDNDSITADDAEDILHSSGMTYSTINDLTDQQIADVSKYTEIQSTIQYIKTDKYGNATNVPAEEAINQAVIVNSLNAPGNDHTIIGGDGGSYLVATDTQTSENSYLRLCLNAYKLANSIKYKYTATAEWLTMPIYRQTDTLGIYADRSTLDDETFYGWYSYTKKITIGGTGLSPSTTVNNERILFNSSDFVLFDSEGVLVQHDLLNDHYNNAATSYFYEEYTNYTIYIECESFMAHPTLETIFVAFATYDHKDLAIDQTISLSLTTDGVSYGIGYELTEDIQRTTADLRIHYTP